MITHYMLSLARGRDGSVGAARAGRRGGQLAQRLTLGRVLRAGAGRVARKLRDGGRRGGGAQLRRQRRPHEPHAAHRIVARARVEDVAHHLRQQTGPPWPSYVRSSSPLTADHARTALSPEPGNSTSTATCRQWTELPWPSDVRSSSPLAAELLPYAVSCRQRTSPPWASYVRSSSLQGGRSALCVCWFIATDLFWAAQCHAIIAGRRRSLVCWPLWKSRLLITLVHVRYAVVSGGVRGGV